MNEDQRLRRRERIAGGAEDPSDEMFEAIRKVEPGTKSQDAETRLGAA
jgi:hypothetical protein